MTSRFLGFIGMNVFTIIIVLFLVVATGASRKGLSQPKGDPGIQPVKTIESEDGDIIDCVDFYKQPAFDHPLLKNRTDIQMSSITYQDNRKTSKNPILQTWQRSGSCPEGAVPILRNQNKKLQNRLFFGANKADESSHIEMAMAYNKNGPYQGASGNLNAWNDVHVEPTDFSYNLVICGKTNGGSAFPDSIQDYIAVGWGVDYGLFGDYNSRLIIGWANGDHNQTWCKNGGCPGYVQTARNYAPGATFTNYSVYGDRHAQFYFPVAIYRDAYLPRWWISINGEQFGFFPVELFDNMGENCDVAMWGGEVLNTNSPRPTPTRMGNGHFGTEGEGRTAIITNALVIKSGAGGVVEAPSGYLVTKPLCYNINATLAPGAWGDPKQPIYFYYFGGPGANAATCV